MIGPSNLNTNISVLMKEIQRNIFARGVPGGWVWAIFIFSLILEIGPFHINQKNSKIFFAVGAQGGGCNISSFFIITDRIFKL